MSILEDLLATGMQAPAFEAPDQEGRTVRLGDLRGRVVVLYFYPKDDTPGCAAEACAFRDQWDAFRDEGAAVLGVSTDSVESHERFAAKHDLPFPLLADPEGRIAKAYGALKESGTAKRVTYVIAHDGRVAAVFPKVTPATHPAEALEAVRRAKAESPSPRS